MYKLASNSHENDWYLVRANNNNVYLKSNFMMHSKWQNLVLIDTLTVIGNSWFKKNLDFYISLTVVNKIVITIFSQLVLIDAGFFFHHVGQSKTDLKIYYIKSLLEIFCIKVNPLWTTFQLSLFTNFFQIDAI